MANDRPILFDVTRLVWRRWVGRLPTGIDRVCLAYLDHYRGSAQAVVHSKGFRRILSVENSDTLFALLSGTRSTFRTDLVRLTATGALARSLPGLDRLYLNVGHTALQNPAYREWTRTNSVRPIYFLHDLIPITHPEYCRAGEALRHRQRIRTMLSSGIGIIGNSRSTIASLQRFADDEGIDCPATLLAPLGSDLVESPANHDQYERPTFVILGTIEARKNHLFLLQLWARMVERKGPATPQLLVIGQRGWESEQAVDLLERSEQLRGHVIEVGRCSDADLATHLGSARALLFPSLVEGYGLPLVEALAAGTPVLASDIEVFREIGGTNPDYIDPLDGPSWIDAIEDYADDRSARRDAQLERLKSYAPPRWPDHFAKVDAWLSTL